MGCDIHMHAYQKKRDGLWIPIDGLHWDDYESRLVRLHTYESRNYSVFSLLAGVQNNGEIEPMAPPRGMPKDMPALWELDPYLRYGEEDFGDHSFSWFSLPEIKAGLKAARPPKDLPDAFAFFGAVMDNLEFLMCGHEESVRLVFGFDN